MAATNSAPPSPNGLAWLIGPEVLEQFFASHWRSQPLMINRDQPSYYVALPGMGMIDRLLTTTVFGTEERVGHLLRMQDGRQVSRPFRLTADGRPDIHDIYRAYSDGYSIVLNCIEARSPIVGEVCRQLEADVQHRVGANLYVTPRDSQGARAHIDAHDVIIAQIDGVKSWRVATDPRTRNPPSRTGGRPSTCQPGHYRTIQAWPTGRTRDS